MVDKEYKCTLKPIVDKLLIRWIRKDTFRIRNM